MTTRRTYLLALAGVLLVGLGVILFAARLYFRGNPQTAAHHQQFLQVKTKAEQGDVEAQSNLGDQYFYGEGTAKDPVEAVKWWRKAAENGDPKSQFSMAYSHFNGLGVEKDPKQGLKWYQSAMEQGFNPRDVSIRFMTGVDIRMNTPPPGNQQLDATPQ